MNENVEIRAFNFEVRAQVDEERGTYIEGTPIVYDSWTNMGWYDEGMDRGARMDTDLRDVRFLVNHDTSMIPLARSRNNNANSTMQMTVDDQGLSIRVDLDVKNNSDARNLYSAIERGDITGMSFMFRVDDEEWQDLESDHPTRIIRKISDVAEVSAVTWPAYEDTSISVRNKAALDNAKLALDSARRSLDSDAKELELAKAKFEAILKVR